MADDAVIQPITDNGTLRYRYMVGVTMETFKKYTELNVHAGLCFYFIVKCNKILIPELKLY